MQTLLGPLASLARVTACALLLPLAAAAQEGAVVTQKSTYSIARIGNGVLTQTLLFRGADRQKAVTQGRARFLVLSRDASGTEIVRLDEERILRIDHRRRQYQTASFAELRAELERVQRQAEAAAAESRREDLRLWIEREPPLRSGQQRMINGFSTEHLVLRSTVMGENPRTGERGAVFHLAADIWLDPTQLQVARTAQAFARAYADRLGLDVRTVGNPYARWIGELLQDIGALEGYPIASHLTFEAASNPPPLRTAPPSPTQPPAAEGPLSPAGNVWGTAMRRPGRARRDEPATEVPAAPGRQLLFSMSTEVLTISAAAPDTAEFEVPPGFRRR